MVDDALQDRVDRETEFGPVLEDVVRRHGSGAVSALDPEIFAAERQDPLVLLLGLPVGVFAEDQPPGGKRLASDGDVLRELVRTHLSDRGGTFGGQEARSARRRDARELLEPEPLIVGTEMREYRDRADHVEVALVEGEGRPERV